MWFLENFLKIAYRDSTIQFNNLAFNSSLSNIQLFYKLLHMVFYISSIVGKCIINALECVKKFFP